MVTSLDLPNILLFFNVCLNRCFIIINLSTNCTLHPLLKAVYFYTDSFLSNFPYLMEILKAGVSRTCGWPFGFSDLKHLMMNGGSDQPMMFPVTVCVWPYGVEVSEQCLEMESWRR